MPDPVPDSAAAAALADRLAHPEPLRRGSLSERFVKCSKPGCPCAADPAARHGPYLSLTRAVQGKTQSRLLSPPQAERARRQIAAGHQFRQQVDAYWKICEQWPTKSWTNSPRPRPPPKPSKKGAPSELPSHPPRRDRKTDRPPGPRGNRPGGARNRGQALRPPTGGTGHRNAPQPGPFRLLRPATRLWLWRPSALCRPPLEKLRECARAAAARTRLTTTARPARAVSFPATAPWDSSPVRSRPAWRG